MVRPSLLALLVMLRLGGSAVAETYEPPPPPPSLDETYARKLIGVATQPADADELKRLRMIEPGSLAADARARHYVALADQLAATERTLRRRGSAHAKRALVQAVSAYRKVMDDAELAKHVPIDHVMFRYAMLLRDARYPTEARAVFQALIKKFPRSPYVVHAYASFGDHFAEAGQLDQADKFYRQVLKYTASPMYSYAAYRLAWVHFKRQQFQEALELFVQVAWRAKDAAQAPLRRAAALDFVLAYAEIGKADKAAAAFKRVDAALAIDMLDRLAVIYEQRGDDAKALAVRVDLANLAAAP